MSEVFALGAKIMCNHDIAGLVNSQRQLCRENPEVVVSIGKGAKLGVEECQHQFKDHRWNCSKVARDVSVFGKVMKKGMYILSNLSINSFPFKARAPTAARVFVTPNKVSINSYSRSDLKRQEKSFRVKLQ